MITFKEIREAKEITYRVGDKKQHGNMGAKDLKDLMAKLKAAKFDMKTLSVYDKSAKKQIMTKGQMVESVHVNCGTPECCQQCDTAETVTEGFSPKEIKMAIGVASDKRYAGGNMTGAVKAIEKIKKGLSKDKQVAAVLRRQNEDIEEAMSPKEKAAHDKAIAAFKKRGGKIKKLPPGKAQGSHGKDDPGDGVMGMLDRGDSSKFKRGKKVRSMRAGYESFKNHEAREIDSKKMSAYMKFIKDKKVDDDSVRMAADNPNHPESKRVMKDKNYAKALKMYQAAGK